MFSICLFHASVHPMTLPTTAGVGEPVRSCAALPLILNMATAQAKTSENACTAKLEAHWRNRCCCYAARLNWIYHSNSCLRVEFLGAAVSGLQVVCLEEVDRML